MRVSSVYPPQTIPVPFAPRACDSPAGSSSPAFEPFSQDAFVRARAQGVPVFVMIGEIRGAFSDPALSAQLHERTVPVHLTPGARPDVELLCQRAGALFSGEGALPLCALMTEDALPFLAAPLPPHSSQTS